MIVARSRRRPALTLRGLPRSLSEGYPPRGVPPARPVRPEADGRQLPGGSR
jgi:hypothetical protein